MFQNKKGGFALLWVILIVVVVALVAWAIIEHQGQSPAQAPAPAATNTIQQYSNGQLPPDMPQDVILASDAKVLNSYSGLNSQGRQGSVVIYSTNQPQYKAFFAYMQYFSKGGWTISSISGTQSISGMNSSTEMSVDLTQATSSLMITVTAFK